VTSPTPSRRGFLKGSSFFAAGLALARAAHAQDPPKTDPPKTAPSPEPPRDGERRKGPKTDEEIFAEQEKEQKKELLDDEGREYRICPQCGNRMYRQGRVWTCSNCGYNYVD